MSLLPNGFNPKSLQDVFNQVGSSQTANLTDQYQQQRKRAVAGQAASGRLMSGVKNYPLTDLDTSYQQGLSGIQTGLAGEEASIPNEDWLNSQDFNRSYQLAKLIGGLNKPSTLEEVMQGIGSIGPLVAVGAGLL